MDFVLRCIPIDHIRLVKSAPGTNIVVADPRPLDSDQLPVLTTQMAQNVVKSNLVKSIDLDKTKDE